MEGSGFTDVNEIVISADGYKDLEVTVDQKGNQITGETASFIVETPEASAVEKNQASEEEKTEMIEEIIEDTEAEENTEIEESEDPVEIEEDASEKFVLDEAPEL